MKKTLKHRIAKITKAIVVDDPNNYGERYDIILNIVVNKKQLDNIEKYGLKITLNK